MATIKCRYFIAGSCKFGDQCRFLHASDNQRTVQTNEMVEDIAEGPVWPFSSYKDYSSGNRYFDDLSPEEVILEGRKSGSNYQGFVSTVTSHAAKALEARRNIVSSIQRASGSPAFPVTGAPLLSANLFTPISKSNPFSKSSSSSSTGFVMGMTAPENNTISFGATRAESNSTPFKIEPGNSVHSQNMNHLCFSKNPGETISASKEEYFEGRIFALLGKVPSEIVERDCSKYDSSPWILGHLPELPPPI